MKPLPDDPAATDADREFMRRAYELARSAVEHGNEPFGALLARHGKIIAEFENAILSKRDVTLHAETGLVSLASRKFDDETLSRSTLYTSTEPCLMCCGAIHWAGIARVVFGTTGAGMTAMQDEPYHGFTARDAFTRIASQAEVVGPVMEEEGLVIHRDFWPGYLSR